MARGRARQLIERLIQAFEAEEERNSIRGLRSLQDLADEPTLQDEEALAEIAASCRGFLSGPGGLEESVGNFRVESFRVVYDVNGERVLLR